jgi:hypothetical protein
VISHLHFLVLLPGIAAVDENGSITAVELIDGGSFTGKDEAPGDYNLDASNAALLLSASKQSHSTPESSMSGHQQVAAAGGAAGLLAVVAAAIVAAVVTRNRRAAAAVQAAHALTPSSTAL